MISEVVTSALSHHTAPRATSGFSMGWVRLWRESCSVRTATTLVRHFSYRQPENGVSKDPCLHRIASLFLCIECTPKMVPCVYKHSVYNIFESRKNIALFGMDNNKDFTFYLSHNLTIKSYICVLLFVCPDAAVLIYCHVWPTSFISGKPTKFSVCSHGGEVIKNNCA
jgi:hypothetical protein